MPNLMINSPFLPRDEGGNYVFASDAVARITFDSLQSLLDACRDDVLLARHACLTLVQHCAGLAATHVPSGDDDVYDYWPALLDVMHDAQLAFSSDDDNDCYNLMRSLFTHDADASCSFAMNTWHAPMCALPFDWPTPFIRLHHDDSIASSRSFRMCMGANDEGDCDDSNDVATTREGRNSNTFAPQPN